MSSGNIQALVRARLEQADDALNAARILLEQHSGRAAVNRAYYALTTGGNPMRTYRALLHGDRLEWLGEAPESQADTPLRVEVTVVEQAPVSEAHARGPTMAALLEKLAARGTFAAITDPVRWQRELRQDRGLPGRTQ